MAGAVLLCVLPFMAARATIHMAVASHWLLTAALWIYFDAIRAPARFARWIALMPLAALINPYLFVTISPVFAASAVALLWKGPVNERRRVLLQAVTAGGLSLFALYLVGYGTVSVRNTWGFYGQLQVNLLAWFNSMGVGTLSTPLPVAELGQTDPFMYLGLGAIAVLLAGAWMLWRARARPDPIHWPLAVAIALLLAAAISHRVALGPWFLIDLHPLPQGLQDLLDPFRASGRLAWLPTYLVLALAIAGCARLLPPRAALLLLAVAVAVNLVDGRNIRATGQTITQRAAHPGTPDCTSLPASVKRVEFVPQVALEDLSTAGAWPVLVCAGRQGQPINVGALARTDLARFNASAREAAQSLERPPASDVAYAYANPATGAALGAGAVPKMGDYYVYVPGVAASAPAAWDPAWSWPLEIPMGVIGPGRHLLLWGWTPPDWTSVRTWADRAVLLLPIPPGQSGEALLTLAARAMPQGTSPLTVQVSANGTPLQALVLPSDPGLAWRAIRIPAEVVAAARGALRVEFVLPAVAPLKHPRSFPDDRLRFSFERLALAATKPGAVAGQIRGHNTVSLALGRGWSAPEPWGVWSDSKVATLRLPVPEGANRDLRLRVRAHAISRTGSQDVRVLVSGREVARWSFGSQQPSESREAVIPAALAPAGGEIEIAFEIANPGPPANGADTRNLGLGLVDFELARP